MDKRWMITILLISFTLLALLKEQELRSLKPFFRAERTIKLHRFSEAQKHLPLEDKELLKLWESMLTGRSAPVSRWMKDQYRQLGLNHLFTPSGFHLTAVLFPLTKFLNSQHWQLMILSLIGFGLLFLPGQVALKRMVLIKTNQQLWGMKTGFVLALMLDMLLGSFQEGALSFTYSFVFLGIIYSGVKGAGLILWFFLAQMLLAYFQGNFISPLLLLISPVMNLAFAFAMPALFLLAFPLWKWQLMIGLCLLKCLQQMVHVAAAFIQLMPTLEVNLVLLTALLCLLLRKPRLALVLLSIISFNLNRDLSREPSLGSWDFQPRGPLIKVISSTEQDVAYYQDGKCSRKLVRGFWWENCSPSRVRRSKEKFKKLSYPSSEQRRSSLRG